MNRHRKLRFSSAICHPTPRSLVHFGDGLGRQPQGEELFFDQPDLVSQAHTFGRQFGHLFSAAILSTLGQTNPEIERLIRDTQTLSHVSHWHTQLKHLSQRICLEFC